MNTNAPTNQMFDLLKGAAVAVGIIVLLLSALFIVLALRGRKKGKKRLVFNISAVSVAALCLVVIFVANLATSMFSNTINSAMTASASAASETNVDDWKNIAYSIAEDGMTLLENKDNVLPFTDTAKVNLLGYFAYNPIYSGTGSGFVGAADSYSIISSLNAASIEVNPAIEASGIYKEAVKEQGEGFGFVSPDFELHDPATDVFTGDISFDAMKEYSDTAIIVLGRRGAEITDLPDGILTITENEDALLSSACDAFEKVIVLLNTANAFEMGWTQQYDVDAVIWTGLPGPYGFEALGKILTGDVNPSGRVVDTWLYDNDSNPVSENFGEQMASNGEGRYYVDYVEGIYLGYKWFETAYAEQAVITNTKTNETFDYKDYDSIVAYPFGYGLSYTTFSQKITGGTLLDGAALSPDDSYTMEVTVTNTGEAAGKCAVQMYVTVPYTDYDRANLVEKSEVSLVAYGKTGLIEPGKAETVTLEFSMEALASYDRTHSNDDGTMGAYMLDDGDYVFSLRANSHEVIDTVSARLESIHFYSGENKRSTDQVPAVNQFDDAARGEYLTRQNAFANYAAAMASVSDEVGLDYVNMSHEYDPAYDEAVTVEYVDGVDYNADGNLKLADMAGLDYDDPKWSQLISQMSLEDLLSLTGETMYSSAPIDSIGKTATADADGPLGLSSMFKNDLVSVSFPCVPLLAATFDADLAYQMGSCVADQAILNGITSWYAPAMDMHRFAYSGRNYEYYSEDTTLSAGTAAAETLGARDKGIIVYIKHFALNDMESMREYQHTYSNEQAIREIYLKPFEYAVKFGHANGVMSSMNYIGDIYAGGHAALLTDVLRNEWGFFGTVLTDMDQAFEFQRVFWSSLRAGVDFWLGYSGTKMEVRNNADIFYLQQAVHRQLYNIANCAVQGTVVLNWQGVATVIYVELCVLAAACIVSMIIRNKGTSGRKKTA